MRKKIFTSILLLVYYSARLFAQDTTVNSKTMIQDNITARFGFMERQELNKQLQYSFEKLNVAIKNLTDSQFNFRPSSNKWTIAECIEHITLAELKFPEIVKEEMKKEADPAFRNKIKINDKDIRTKMLSRRWKAKSPEIFKPSGKFTTVKTAIETFTLQRQQTIDYIKYTNDDIRNHFWKHPLTGHIDLYQTLLLMSAHLERHTEQIENIKKLVNFPI